MRLDYSHIIRRLQQPQQPKQQQLTTLLYRLQLECVEQGVDVTEMLTVVSQWVAAGYTADHLRSCLKVFENSKQEQQKQRKKRWQK